MKTKKIPYYLLIGSLTLGASLILGFLSFTGAMALWSIVPVASLVFALSVAYEGEIYLQNIKGALDKLGFKGNFMHRRLARQYLAEYAPSEPGKGEPVFFQTYVNMLALKEQYKQKKILSLQDRKSKRALNKSIKKMEKWFTVLLMEQKQPGNEIEKELVQWLKLHHQTEWKAKANQRQYYYYLSAGFSAIAGLSMTYGTTYLLLGALSSVPMVLSAPPLLLVTGISLASLIAGGAYGLLTFNTLTDIIDNDTVQNWLKKLKHNLIEKPSLRSVLVSSIALVLFTLALALTICTAGTWWTVIKQTPPLFRWMAKIPTSLLMMAPIINGGAALSFNFQNTAESFEMVDNMIDHQSAKPFRQRIADTWNNLTQSETFWQITNPFRLLLKLTFTPLRILLFLGHLVSIALTSDRLPGVPQIVSFLVGFICEGFEDAHYFLGFDSPQHHNATNADILKEHLSDEEEHNHDNDLPTRLLTLIFTPMFYLAAFWDYKFSASPNWQQSLHKFKLNNEEVNVDEDVSDLKIKSSQHLSRLVVSALQDHIKSSLPVNSAIKETSDAENTTRKLGFFNELEPLIQQETSQSDIAMQI